MTPTAVPPSPTAVGPEPDESAIAAYEQALRHGPDPALADFVPPSGPNRLPTLVELVRSDLEWRWDRGTPKPAAAYLAEYPELAAATGAVAFEEYRARLRSGEPVRPEDFRARYQISTDSWPALDRSARAPSAAGPDPTLRQPIQPVSDDDRLDGWVKTLPGAAVWPLDEVRSGDPAAVAEWRSGMTDLPEVGAEFLGFHLVEELGCGAFGRVFLARQGDLAGRLVALKVGTGLFTESQKLAQLQHTNIVPVYSVHQARHVQAVCMPFFGRTTLGSVLTGLRGHPTLPASGDVLLSTVQQRASATRADSRAATGATPASTESDPAVEPAAWGMVKRLSYPNAVAWVGAQLAAGLAHAHQRGILHRDLKPANVLLTDDGVPMLLDFNLAEDTKVQGQLGGAAIGGTLPYMAPEQMSAFARLGGRPDARSDVYSLGVMLHELLTGQRPFPEPEKGPLREVVELLLADRRREVPSARAANPAVPSAVDAVVRKCLAFDPAARYPSAADLQEDLERHLANRPLRHAREPFGRERARKWVARHPRACSSATIAVVAAVLLAAVAAGGFYARERSRAFEARSALQEHRAELRSLQAALDDRNRLAGRTDEALDRCRAVLGRYGISADGPGDAWERGTLVRYLSDADRLALRGDAGEVFYLMARSASIRAQLTADPAERADLVRRAEAWTAAAERYGGDRLPRALAAQKADLASLRGDTAAERAGAEAARTTSPATARDHYLVGAWYTQHGRHRDALPFLRTATQMEPEDFTAWFVRGTCHLALEQPELAALCFGSCVAVDKDFAPAWLNRGVAYSRLRFFPEACSDFDRALRLDPNLTEARVQRAKARESLHDLPGAIADMTLALEDGGAPTRLYFIRARLRDAAGDKAGAVADRAEGLKRTPADDLSWVARAEARLAKDPEGALADVTEALRLNPVSMFGLQLRAHILAERIGRPDEAIRTLDKAVELYPEYAPAVAGRGVLLARAGRRAEAIRDAEEALLRDSRAPNLYQVGCIYALTTRIEPADKLKAFQLLWAGLRTGFGLDIVDTDPDLNPLRAEPEFRRLVAAAKARQADPAR